MGVKSDIVRRLSSQQLGATANAFIVLPVSKDEKETDNFIKKNPITFCNQKEALEKEQEFLIKEIDKWEKVVMIRVSFEVFEVIKLKEKRCEIKLNLPINFKKMTIKEREFWEKFLEEAWQVIRERQKMVEIIPYASTGTLTEKYNEAISEYYKGAENTIEEIENIFTF